jgi:hypothetical protein
VLTELPNENPFAERRVLTGAEVSSVPPVKGFGDSLDVATDGLGSPKLKSEGAACLGDRASGVSLVGGVGVVDSVKTPNGDTAFEVHTPKSVDEGTGGGLGNEEGASNSESPVATPSSGF